ncbi:hypothetical protein HYW17_00960 [Candidatus Uhrbacteria bacterium]|nr:hypothetical protein [Candidatus Uhrbacteria bacterium]
MSNRKITLLYFASVGLSALVFPFLVYFMHYTGGPQRSIPFWFLVFEILSLGGFTIPIIIYVIFPLHTLHFTDGSRKYLHHLCILAIGIILYVVMVILLFGFLNVSPAVLPL